MGFFSTIKSVSKIAAACGIVATSNACLVVGRETGIAARKVAGDSWDKVPGSATNEKLVRELSPAVEKALAEYVAKVGEKQVEQKAAAPADEEDHSDKVEWKKGRWVPSAKATEEAKKAGHEQAFLPQMYKAANWISRVTKEGGDKVYSTAQGETHTYLGWTYKAVYGHAAFMEGKGVKNAKTAEKLAEYFEQACKHSKVAEDKLPTWEEVCAAVQAEQKLAKEEAAVEAEVVVETAEAEEVRDGRAPKTAPAASKMDVKSIVRSLGIVRLKEDNAWEVAEKAKAAFEAATLTEEEFYAVVDACQAKDASADPEEYMALLGEN